MDYKKLHDSIINRALSRTPNKNIYYESHHIIPKCEGGDPKGDTVSLTSKEHRIVHKLRYKFTNVVGNICAYNMMKIGEDARREVNRIAAIYLHKHLKEKDLEKYKQKQGMGGKVSGKNLYLKKKGIFAIPENEMKEIRMRGTQTLMREKLGLFSDEFKILTSEKRKKRVCINNKTFNSCTEAAKHFNVCNGTITYWIKTGKAKILFEGEWSNKGKKS